MRRIWVAQSWWLPFFACVLLLRVDSTRKRLALAHAVFLLVKGSSLIGGLDLLEHCEVLTLKHVFS